MNGDLSSPLRPPASTSKRPHNPIYVPATPISRVLTSEPISSAKVKETPEKPSDRSSFGHSSDIEFQSPKPRAFNASQLDKTPVMNPYQAPALLNRFKYIENGPVVQPLEPRLNQAKRVSNTHGSSSAPQNSMDISSIDSDARDEIFSQMMDRYPDADFGVLEALLQECNYDMAKASSLMDNPAPKRRKLIKKADIPPPPILQPIYMPAPIPIPGPRFASAPIPVQRFAPAPPMPIPRPMYAPAVPQPIQRVVNGRVMVAGTAFQPKRPAARARKPRNSDSEESAPSGSDTDESMYSDNEEELNVKVLSFVNTASKEALIETALCSEEQAELITSMTPFSSYEQMAEALSSKKKGKTKILSKVLEKCRETLSGYEQIDTLIATCEERGGEIMKVLDEWRSKGHSAPLEEDGDDSGFSLAEVADDGTSDADDHSATSCLKKQPSFIGDDIRLKDYQLVGVSWLYLLFSMNLGAILADEMGLGKTAQVICFLGLLKERNVKGPHLIIVPNSTLENWMREIERWCPSMFAVAYYGSQAERAELRLDLLDNCPDIIVTTYNTSSGQKEDRNFLKKMRFKTMILDEGHMVKNRLSARYKGLDSIKVQFRVLLTGTPLQNNLLELLSLLTFILPDVFRDEESHLFKIFNTKGLANSSSSNILSQIRISRARKMMMPFVLRRKKVNVLKELPKKIQTLELCKATESQEALYKGLIADCKQTYATGVPDEKVEDEKPAKTKGGKSAKAKGGKKLLKNLSNVSNAIMHLRKAANHPLLFRRIFTDAKIKSMAKDILKEDEFLDSTYEYVIEDMEVMSDFELHKLAVKYKRLQKYRLPDSAIMDSGKVARLQTLLPELIERGCRILLFSQFVIMLDVLESVLGSLGIGFVRLDGQIPSSERQIIIDEFNTDMSIPVFLLSTKACGLGLNLTSANVVILHDIDFNPHNDAQAEDRAHRVGQTRDVHVHKLILDNTIEQHMLNLAAAKLSLDRQIHDDGDDSTPVEKDVDEEEEVPLNPETSTSVLNMLRQEWFGGDTQQPKSE
ncbi:hypothetical protein HDU67_006324 [Dinochytrium kinnereticum]|nr:hypothetical protein HDU67_006324 [Dinochytrium kinnereticum]